jgi:hypothetical protein
VDAEPAARARLVEEARLVAVELAGAACVGAAGPGLVAHALVPHARASLSNVVVAVVGAGLLGAAALVLAPRAERRRAGRVIPGAVRARLLGLAALAAVVAGLAALFGGADVERAITTASLCVSAGLAALVAALALEVRRLAGWAARPLAWWTRARAVVVRVGGGIGATWLAFVAARALGDAPTIAPLGTAETLRVSLEAQGVSWAIAGALAAIVGHALRRAAWATLDGG